MYPQSQTDLNISPSLATTNFAGFSNSDASGQSRLAIRDETATGTYFGLPAEDVGYEDNNGFMEGESDEEAGDRDEMLGEEEEEGEDEEFGDYDGEFVKQPQPHA